MYTVHLEVFEGPLDLLLYLIKKDDLNIYDIPIAQITKEYLEHLGLMQEMNLDLAGEFLLMAATLLEIKARMLIPQEEETSAPAEDPRQALVSRLVEYQRYKEIAQFLAQRERAEENIFYRKSPSFSSEEKMMEVGIFELLTAFRDMEERFSREVRTIPGEEITLEERIERIEKLLQERNNLTFLEIFAEETTRIGAIVCFLALLELTRLGRISLYQKEPSREIWIYRCPQESSTASV